MSQPKGEQQHYQQQQELRSYQQSALERARRGNTIMSGDAGVGKTEVALCLIREADFSGDKIGFFLVPNQALAQQQYERIKGLMAIDVALCLGQELDKWKPEEWQKLFRKKKMVVCCHQILLNLLEKGDNYLYWSRISLLIIDECHQATKRHPLVELMARYPSDPPRPLVFGMTATLGSRKCANKLHCSVYVCDEEATQAYAATCPLTIVPYQPPSSSQGDSTSNPSSLTAAAVGEGGKKSRKEEKDFVYDPLTPSETTFKDLIAALPFLRKGRYILKNGDIKDVESSYRQGWGPWFYLKHIELLLSYIQCKRMSHLQSTTTTTTTTAPEDPDHLKLQREMALAQTICLFLHSFLKRAAPLIAATAFGGAARPSSSTNYTTTTINGNSNGNSNGNTHKINHQNKSTGDRLHGLLQILATQQQVQQEGELIGEAAEAEAEAEARKAPSSGRAMIFVERRLTCRLLREFLNQLPNTPYYQKVGYALGQSRSSGTAAASGGDVAGGGDAGRQRDAVDRFAEGKHQVLVATSVLSHGIDIQECDLVVCLDNIPTAVMLAQMRGRARDKNGRFIAFVPDEEAKERLMDLERKANEFVKGKLDEQLAERNKEMLYSNSYDAYVYTTPTKAVLSMDNSLRYVFALCQQTHECRQYELVPIFDIDEYGGNDASDPPIPHIEFHCQLTMPALFGLDVIKTPIKFRSKNAAKAVCAFWACKQLHQNGVIDDDLNPQRTEVVLKDFAYYEAGLAANESTLLAEKKVDLEMDPTVAIGIVPINSPSTASSSSASSSFSLPASAAAVAVGGRARGEAAAPGGGGGGGGGRRRVERGEAAAPAVARAAAAAAGRVLLSSLTVPSSSSSASVTATVTGDTTGRTLYVYRLDSSLLPPTPEKNGGGGGVACSNAVPIGLATLSALGVNRYYTSKQEVQVNQGEMDRLLQWHHLVLYVVMHGKQCFDPSSPFYLPTSAEEAIKQIMSRSSSSSSISTATSWDKGYLLLPLLPSSTSSLSSSSSFTIDWGLVNRTLTSSQQLQSPPLWPSQASMDASDWLVFTRLPPSLPAPYFTRLYAGVRVLKDKSLRDVRRHAERKRRRATVPPPPSTANSTNMEVDSYQEADEAENEGKEEEREGKEEEEEGEEPRLILSQYTKEVWDACDQSQPLLLVDRIMDSDNYFRRALGRNALTTERLQQRLLAPEMCTLVFLPKSLFCFLQAIIPTLWKVESDLKVQSLLHRLLQEGVLRPEEEEGAVGGPFSLSLSTQKLIADAISKPDYETLEVLGDAHLNVTAVQYAIRVHQPCFLEQEGLLMDMAKNLVCNVRLMQCAKAKLLEQYIILRNSTGSSGFKSWSPSLCPPIDEKWPRVAGKVVADVVEALIAACLLSQGPRAANRFMRWMGLPTICRCDDGGGGVEEMKLNGEGNTTSRNNEENWSWPMTSMQRGYESCCCWDPKALLATSNGGKTVFPSSHPPPSPGTTYANNVETLEQILGYSFKNKWLAVEALTHPSYRCTSPTLIQDGHRRFLRDYQRLEYLGDKLLDYLTITHLYFRHMTPLALSSTTTPTSTPPPSVSSCIFSSPTSTDTMTKQQLQRKAHVLIHEGKHATVTNNNLAYKAVTWLKIQKVLLCGSLHLWSSIDFFVSNIGKVTKQRRRKREGADGGGSGGGEEKEEKYPKPLADVMEALIAAVFIDSGGDFDVISRLFLPRLMSNEEGEEQMVEVEEQVDAEEQGRRTALGEREKVMLKKAVPKLWRLCEDTFPEVLEGIF